MSPTHGTGRDEVASNRPRALETCLSTVREDSPVKSRYGSITILDFLKHGLHSGAYPATSRCAAVTRCVDECMALARCAWRGSGCGLSDAADACHAGHARLQQ